MTDTPTTMDEQEEFRQKLLWNVKREVKQLMEEAVMKKCIHEDNCSVTTLSSSVEACLLYGLKRRAVGLFKTSTTMALLQKIAKICSSAGEVVKIIEDEQRQNEQSTYLFSFSKKTTTNNDNPYRSIQTAVYNRYLWIRIALVHRLLHKIVEYIVNNSSNYYEPYALVRDCVQGPILASLLAGSCALEFTRVKTSDHLWTDPHANELVQRHRMHSNNRISTNPKGIILNMENSYSPKFQPKLQSKCQKSLSNEDTQRTPRTMTSSTNPGKDYVESLHQNAKSQIIYGKNNVLVQPIPGHDPIPGYLSLHLNQIGLTLKWTPNQLMNGTKVFDNNSQETETTKRSSILWDYAISVNMSSIVYLHCHQHIDGDRIVLVGRDGVQYPPLHIKDKGGHLLAFLTCLESGLAPHGQLDPPLWFEEEQGKTFPKLSRRIDRTTYSISDEEIHFEDDSILNNGDYVFRIVFYSDQEPSSNSSTNSNRWQWPILTSTSQSLSSQCSFSPPSQPLTSTSLSISPFDNSITNCHPNISVQSSIASLCDTMRRQILSRAFYGWLAYCRHLRTVRTHLISLVYPVSIEFNQTYKKHVSLTNDAWKELFLDKQNDDPISIDKTEIYRRIYSGGCDPSIRKQVWPFLFQHYSFESNADQRKEIDQTVADRYQTLMNEWQHAEEIITKIDLQRLNHRKTLETKSETSLNPNQSSLLSFKHVLAKISLPTFDHHHERKHSNTSNDVFYEDFPIHTVTISSSEQADDSSVIIARTHTESVIDRSSPYNIIETSTDNDDDDEMIVTNTMSTSSSVTSGADIYMDAIEIIDDHQSDGSLTPIYYGSFSKEIIDTFATNLHRIDKDVYRCDRHYSYFINFDNLKKLRNIMCTYIWENLTTGYIQGMCDLVAPLLVLFDQESLTYNCFCYLMKRLLPNFPHGSGMDEHFGHMRSLLQILDTDLYEHIHRTGDFTHFYFCYRWFLLDFKREFLYDDIYLVWEVNAAARRTVTKRFVLFIALAMMKSYRDIILDNRMDFTDIIRFFNEMAERHDAREILRIARELILELQKLMDNK